MKNLFYCGMLRTHISIVISALEAPNGSHLGHCTKIYDDNILLVDDKQRTVNAFIDIFVLDPVPDSPREIRKILIKHKFLSKFATSVQKRIAETEKYPIIQIMLKPVFNMVLKLMVGHVKSLTTKYSSTNTYVCMLSEYFDWTKACFPKAYFQNTIPCEFEREILPIMNGYDEYLHLYYGEYMQLPPIEKQVPHHSSAVYRLK